MTSPRTLDNYGGVYVDAKPVEVAVQEQSASYANRLHEDAAQMTRTTFRAWVKFTTTTTAAVVAVTPTAGRSHMGSGSGALPTISKTATGKYTITYPASFVDGLGATETISFTAAMVGVGGAGVAGQACHGAIVGPVIDVEVRDSAGTLSDLASAGIVTVFAE